MEFSTGSVWVDWVYISGTSGPRHKLATTLAVDEGALQAAWQSLAAVLY